MFQYRRKVKCMLDTIIVTPYHNDSIKFIPMSAKNIYDLPSSSMHRNIAISNFQLNFARQILSPHISDPSKKISPSTKQIIDLRVLKSAYGFYFIIEASNPVPTPLLGHRCRSSQEITGSPTPFSTSNHYLWICPRASFSLSNPNIAA